MLTSVRQNVFRNVNFERTWVFKNVDIWTPGCCYNCWLLIGRMFWERVERGVAALVLVLANLNPASVLLMASSARWLWWWRQGWQGRRPRWPWWLCWLWWLWFRKLSTTTASGWAWWLPLLLWSTMCKPRGPQRIWWDWGGIVMTWSS